MDVESDNQRPPKRLRAALDTSTTTSIQKAEKGDDGAPEFEESTAAKEGIRTATMTSFAIPPEHKSAEASLSVLPLPSPGDTKAQFHSKLVALAEVIISRSSITLATGYAATTDPDNDAVKAAVSQMPPSELKLWKYFVDGSISLPEIEWTRDQEPAPTSPKSLRIACRRAEALNRLYKTDKANERHVAWLTKRRIVYLPLVKAMARVIGAERNLSGGNVRCSAAEFADLQSINRILSLSSNIITADGLSKGLVDITTAPQVLSRRRRELRVLIGKGSI